MKTTHSLHSFLLCISTGVNLQFNVHRTREQLFLDVLLCCCSAAPNGGTYTVTHFILYDYLPAQDFLASNVGNKIACHLPCMMQKTSMQSKNTCRGIRTIPSSESHLLVTLFEVNTRHIGMLEKARATLPHQHDLISVALPWAAACKGHVASTAFNFMKF